MSYQDLFTHRDEAELRRFIYLKKPEAIKSIKDIEYYEYRARQAIAEAESLIETLGEYRQALYERYQTVTATNYSLFLKLERRVKYDNSKSYVITISKRFDGNNVEDEETLREVYEGRERHAALKRFEALKKEHPNIASEMDIAKKQWER
jgi:hypothetical protein